MSNPLLELYLNKLKGGNFPKVKILDSFDFSKLPNLDKQKNIRFWKL